MASRFVSGGILAGEGDAAPPPPTPPTSRADGSQSAEGAGAPADPTGPGTGASSVQVEWEAVQRDLEEQRRQREEARRAELETGSGQRSLFEVLQANKEAKEAAFMEANRIKNQFRALDDDEIDFLDGVLDGRRREEERVRREMEERLKSFRKAQQEVVDGHEPVDEVLNDADLEWSSVAAVKKRKREKEKLIKGIKRKSSAGGAGNGPNADELPEEQPTKSQIIMAREAKKPKLGLVDYGSDSDDDGDD